MLPPETADSAELRTVFSAVLGTGALVGIIAAMAFLFAGDDGAAIALSAFGAVSGVLAAWNHRRWRAHRAVEREWFRERRQR